MDKWILLSIISIASFITPFTGSSVNVVIPQIGLEFEADPIILSWFSTSALLASALLFLPVGVYGDIFGRLKIFRYGLAIFAFSTLLAGLALDKFSFLIARFLQGCGSAAISTAGVALISEAFKRDERGFALGLNISAVYVGLTLGPFLGGLVSTFLGWRYIFILIFSFSVVALYASARYLHIRETLKSNGFDYLGSLILGVCFSALVIGFSIYPNSLSLLLFTLFIVSAILFVYWENRFSSPLINIGYFIRNRLLSFSILTSLFIYIATYGTSFLISIYLQYGMGIDPFTTGLILLSRPLVMALLSTFAGRLSDVIQPKYVVTIGLLFDLTAFILLSNLRIGMAITYILSALILLGIGSALFSTPNTNAVMGSVDKSLLGMASGLVGTARVYGQTLSMGIVSLIFSIYISGVKVINVSPEILLMSIDYIFLIYGLMVFIALFPSIFRGDIER